MPSEVYVIDSNTLLNFYCRLEREDLLHKVLRGRLHLTERVKNEVIHYAYGRCAERISVDLSSGRLKVTPVGVADAKTTGSLSESSTFLDPGEAGSAALAKSRGWGFITDDRRAAGDLLGSGIVIRDSQWILKEAERRGYLTRAELKRLSRQLGRQD